MALHIIQRSRAFEACIQVASATDPVILLGEGVNSVCTTELQRPVYAASSDVEARGLAARCAANVALISDEELVELCAEHGPCVTWSRP